MADTRSQARRRIRRLALLCSLLLYLSLDAGLALLLPTGRRDERSSQQRFRTRSPLYDHDLLPNVSAPEIRWGPVRYPVYTNSLGFRDRRPREVPLSPPGQRLLLMGDSFTEGIGVSYEDSFAGLIAQGLAPKGTELLNAGVSSYAPSIHYAKARHLLDTVGLRVSEVAIFLDLSDVCDEAVYYARQGAVVMAVRSLNEVDCLLRPVERGDLLVDLGERSLSLRVLGLAWRVGSAVTAVQDPRSPNWARSAWTTEPGVFAAYGPVGLARAEEAMDRLSDLLKGHGIPLRLVVYPWPHQIFRRDLRSRQVLFWERWARARGHAFLDLFPRFITGEPPAETYRRCFIPGDVHWSREGHRVVAQSFLAFHERLAPAR